MSPTQPPLRDRRYRPVDPTDHLGTATVALYDAFTSVPFDQGMARCPHCVSKEQVELLGSAVPALAPDLVARFVVKAGTTWGGPSDLRRVAPRALDLAAEGRLPVSRTLLWEKLRAAGWPAWPPRQVAAVHGFLEAEWDRLLRSPPRRAHAAHRWLGQTAHGIDDLTPFLDAWHDALGPLTPRPHQEAAVGHLVALLTTSAFRPDLPETVADLVPAGSPAADQLTAWLSGPATGHELRRAAAAMADTGEARRVSVAVERLRRFVLALDQS